MRAPRAGLADVSSTGNCTLVELFSPRLNEAHENISKTLGVNYKPMYCRTDSADIVVNAERLSQRVEECIEDT